MLLIAWDYLHTPLDTFSLRETEEGSMVHEKNKKYFILN